MSSFAEALKRATGRDFNIPPSCAVSPKDPIVLNAIAQVEEARQSLKDPIIEDNGWQMPTEVQTKDRRWKEFNGSLKNLQEVTIARDHTVPNQCKVGRELQIFFDKMNDLGKKDMGFYQCDEGYD